MYLPKLPVPAPTQLGSLLTMKTNAVISLWWIDHQINLAHQQDRCTHLAAPEWCGPHWGGNTTHPRSQSPRSLPGASCRSPSQSPCTTNRLRHVLDSARSIAQHTEGLDAPPDIGHALLFMCSTRVQRNPILKGCRQRWPQSVIACPNSKSTENQNRCHPYPPCAYHTIHGFHLQEPLRTMAHSVVLCQCSSRSPPGKSVMRAADMPAAPGKFWTLLYL